MLNSKPNILVYGYYGKSNLGDELFKEAFIKLFRHCNFTFTDHIRPDHLEDISSVFFGGGSFLDGKPDISWEAFAALKEHKLFYIGVGTETEIHPLHQTLIKNAKLIATRTQAGLDAIKKLNQSVIVIPDLVYACNFERDTIVENSVLILPNISVVPNYSDPYWKHLAWEHFKTEFAQFLDLLISEKYKLNFFSMCQNRVQHDDGASIEIINKMRNRDLKFLSNDFTGFSKYQHIITQRFHGIILAELYRKPYLAIHHHDKLKSSYLNEGIFHSYYEISKNKLVDLFEKTRQIKLNQDLPIKSDIWEGLVGEVRKHLGS